MSGWRWWMSAIAGAAAIVRITNVSIDPGLVPPLSQIPASENISSLSGRNQNGCFPPFSGAYSNQPFTGMTQRRSRKADRKDGFSCTVSERALMRRLAPGLFAAHAWM